MSVEAIPMKVTFLGCGKLNSAILQGILTSLSNNKHSDFQPPSHVSGLTNPDVISPTSLMACVHHQSSAASLAQRFSQFPIVTIHAGENVLGVQRGNVIILGVEPSVYRSVLAEPGMLEALKGKVLVSIVGGVSVAKLYDAIFHGFPETGGEKKEEHCHVMRVTPGVSAAVRESVSLISEEPDRRYPPAVLNAVYSLFMRVGQVKIWPEHLQPAGATITASALAFLSLALEGLADSAVREGIERREAIQMAASCMMGLSKLTANGESPTEVRKKVATPGGSTAAGLTVLEEGKVKDLYMEALRATAFRTNPSTSITTIPPLLNFSATRFPDNDTLSATPTLSATNHFPRFNDTVHQAVIRTEALYPNAIFVGADATSITGPTTDPDRLTDVRLTFSYRVGRYRSIFIEMEAWGQWTRPRPTTISPHKNLGPLPANLGMDLVDASNLLRASGYMQPYDAVDVKWPTPYPVSHQQVFYFFQMEGTEPSTVAVGTRDRSVTPLD